MANANNSIITGRLKGMLGKELVFREWAGKTVVAKAPRAPKGDPSSAQEETRERFLIASKYANAVKQNPDQSMTEAYASALRPRQNVYSRALEDCMTPPKVKDINTRAYTGAAGSKISVKAVDDFRVAEVQVYIYSPDGSLLETGLAETEPRGILWNYTATQANNAVAGTKILAVATDIPGNEGMLEITL
ncbi:MAG: hypothetical protein DI535_10850 [Citrobacter freundii]|nr:MAG: hypothetical protein DI535_10850 [Citrobacter freundii]